MRTNLKRAAWCAAMGAMVMWGCADGSGHSTAKPGASDSTAKAAETKSAAATIPAPAEPIIPQPVAIRRGAIDYVFQKDSEAIKTFNETGKVEHAVTAIRGERKIVGSGQKVLDAYLDALDAIRFAVVRLEGVDHVFVEGSAAHQHFTATGKVERPVTGMWNGRKIVAPDEITLDEYFDSLESAQFVTISRGSENYVFIEGSEAHRHFAATGKIERPITGMTGGQKFTGPDEMTLDMFFEQLGDVEYVTIDREGRTYLFVRDSEEHRLFVAEGKVKSPITVIVDGGKMVAPNEQVVDGYLESR